MSSDGLYGYAGKCLRVDLTAGKITSEVISEDTLRKYIGGASLGIKFIYDEVAPGVGWQDPDNRLFIGSGPLGGTRIGGSGTVTVVTKGALTDGMASSQANGLFGAYLRFSGFDSIIIQGAATEWVYLHIHDGTAEIKDANHLRGKDNFEVDRIIKEELKRGEREASVLSIGPAGENLVRFACLCTDLGHMAAHNGVGAVMGSKRLKAIVVDRGKDSIRIKDKHRLSEIAGELREKAKGDKFHSEVAAWGTLGLLTGAKKMGMLPVKNYTTGIYDISEDKLDKYTPQSIRANFKEVKPKPCWGCQYHHSTLMEIPEGKYAGRIIEEPEYEGIAACSSIIGITDVNATFVLASEIDRLGMDANETGWLIGWLMECYEKGIVTNEDTGGIEMTWGNDEAVMEMLHRIAERQGFGDILAEGVMRASKHVGGEASNMAIYTHKGNTPRGHDHRVAWLEFFDTCVSNTGTLEAHGGAPYKSLGLDPSYDRYGWQDISTIEAKIKGAMIFEDSVVTCRYNTMTDLERICQAVNAATGWDLDIQEAMAMGKRAVNLMRVFNIRHGISTELDAPSARYGSIPPDGPGAGLNIVAHWDEMLANYYKLMGWDEKGKPLPETLKELGLESIIPHLP